MCQVASHVSLAYLPAAVALQSDSREEERPAVMTVAVPRKGLRASPPDGGWGWMIVIGCFLVTICTRAVTR